MKKYTSRKKNRYNKRNKMGILSISGVVLMLLVVVSVKSIEIEQKNKEYTKQETHLEEEKEDEEKRAEQIEDLKKYMASDQFVEEAARGKLGLVYPNEIIFEAEE